VRLETARLVIATPTDEDVPRLLTFHRAERDRLARWAPALPDDFLTEPHWRARVDRFRVEARTGVSLRLFLFVGPSRHVVGLVSFTRLLALPVPQAQVGYALAAAAEGQGLMAEALAASLAHVVRQPGLRRVTATHDVDNTRSARLLARLGFVREGLLPAHLVTNGAPRDHVAMAKDLAIAIASPC